MSRSGPPALAVRPVESRAEQTAFLRVPSALYLGARGYAAVLEFDRRASLNPKTAPYFGHAEARYWIAWRGSTPVGRISAQYDTLAIEAYGQPIGFFGFLDAADDAAVFRALFAEAEAWLHAKGAQIARGPFSHSINEESGLLIDGFEHPPMMMMPYHPPYAKGHVEACGYRKAKDLEAWDRKLKDRRPMRKPDLSGAGVRLRNLNPKDYRGDIERVMAVFNDAWAGNWGFVPFTADEIAHLAQSLRPILSPDLMVIAEQDDTPVAMVIVTPNIAEAVADLDGKLWPLGWAKLLYRLKAGQISSARMPLMGVRRSLQNTLLGAEIVRAMIATVVEAIDARGFERVELSWILEDNAPMQALLKVMRATRYKTYRVFEKSLSAPH